MSKKRKLQAVPSDSLERKITVFAEGTVLGVAVNFSFDLIIRMPKTEMLFLLILN